ncbi:hypothetical protein FCS83_09500 [Oenococcus sp. UCMA 17063]|nr:hypothetical protein [Oenococcus sp. UCMA 17063]
MSKSEGNFVIVNGVSLAKIGPSIQHGGGDNHEERKWKRTFHDAQQLVMRDTLRIIDQVKSSDYFGLDNDFYFEVNVPSAFLVKSYQIESLYKSANLKIVGSKFWKDEDDKNGRSDILSASSLEDLKNFLEIIKNLNMLPKKRNIKDR